jgi:hypothetical protein
MIWTKSILANCKQALRQWHCCEPGVAAKFAYGARSYLTVIVIFSETSGGLNG